MRRWFKGLALFIAVVCLVWVGVLWRWQATHRDMSPEDIVVYLGLLPLVVFGLVLLGRWALRGALATAKTKAEAAAAAAAAAASSASAAPAGPNAEDLARRQTWRILAQGLNCAAGDSVASMGAALKDGEPRPQPDTELVDEEGLPVVVARQTELDVQQDAADIDDLLARVRPLWEAAHPDARWQVDEAVLRALSLLRTPWESVLQDLSAWQPAWGLPLDPDAPPRTAGSQGAQTVRLRVLCQWPSHWQACERHLAESWLKHLAEQAADWMPADRWHWQPPVAHSLLQDGDRLLAHLQREGLQDVVVLVGAQSDLSQQRIDALAQAGQLFSSRHNRAGVAAEAAAVLALAPAQGPAHPEDLPLALCHRPVQAQRDKPVDAGGRVQPTVVESVLQQALELASLPPASLSQLVSDADQHSPRASELFGAVIQQLGHLDAAEDVTLAGPQLGRLGPVAPLVCVMLAAQRALAHAQPCLALSLDDPLTRWALVARPPASAGEDLKKTAT